MTIKELIKELKKLDGDIEVKIGKMIEDDYGEYTYSEIDLTGYNFMISRYDGKTTLIIN